MPWTCPKCGLQVGHGDATHPLPKSDTLYRCPVCHLEQVFDPVQQQMIPVQKVPQLADPHRSDIA